MHQSQIETPSLAANHNHVLEHLKLYNEKYIQLHFRADENVKNETKIEHKKKLF